MSLSRSTVNRSSVLVERGAPVADQREQVLGVMGDRLHVRHAHCTERALEGMKGAKQRADVVPAPGAAPGQQAFERLDIVVGLRFEFAP
jgi:hypothetical protein